jgi:AraC-like DNA-binding protein
MVNSLAIGCVLMLLGCVSWAQVGRIPYADVAPVVDGVGEDWEDVAVIPFGKHHPMGLHANQVGVQLQWDEQFLYLRAAIADDRLVTLTLDTNRIHLNDAVEVYIDPRDDSGARMDINDYQFLFDWEGRSVVLKGDKAAIMDSSKVAPKEMGISTVAFRWAVRREENDHDQDVDSAPRDLSAPLRSGRDDKGGAGYWEVEMALPFAGMGAVPRAGMVLKLDFCVDDVDSLIDLPSWPEEVPLPLYYCSNWDGITDFSFPDRWRRFELVGGPSLGSRIGRVLSLNWGYVVVALVGLGLVIVWQTRRIRQLRDVLPRDQVRAVVRASAVAWEAVSEGSPVAGGEENTVAGVKSGISLSGPLSHPVIERCRQLVLANLDQEMKMEELARECAVSLRQLQRIFKDEMGMSPGNFVVALKMEQAAALLGSGGFNVSEVAWRLGYQDGSYFSRVFKKYHGVAPRQFRVNSGK